MEFKSYISTLFYLTESVGYIDSNQAELRDCKQNLKNSVLFLLNQAFADTNYLCFKYAYELSQEFGDEISFSQPKHCLYKSGARFRLMHNYPLNLDLKNSEKDFDETIPLFNGEVSIKGNYNPSFTEDDFHNDAYTYLSIEFIKCKNFNDNDFRRLVHIIQDILNQARA